MANPEKAAARLLAKLNQIDDSMDELETKREGVVNLLRAFPQWVDLDEDGNVVHVAFSTKGARTFNRRVSTQWLTDWAR